MRAWKDKEAEDDEKNAILSQNMAELKVLKEEAESLSPLK
jgi:hypothetical protein